MEVIELILDNGRSVQAAYILRLYRYDAFQVLQPSFDF